LDHKLHPFGNKIDPFYDLATIVSFLTKEQKPFCLSVSPDKQKSLSLWTLCLCGEKLILLLGPSYTINVRSISARVGRPASPMARVIS